MIANEFLSLDGVAQAPGAAALRPLRLVDSQVTTTGAILATYVPPRADAP